MTHNVPTIDNPSDYLAVAEESILALNIKAKEGFLKSVEAGASVTDLNPEGLIELARANALLVIARGMAK